MAHARSLILVNNTHNVIYAILPHRLGAPLAAPGNMTGNAHLKIMFFRHSEWKEAVSQGIHIKCERFEPDLFGRSQGTACICV